jgi:hypothetical protein
MTHENPLPAVDWQSVAAEQHAALKALFENCAMTHKHWGEGCNQKQSDAAQVAGRAVIAAYEAAGLAPQVAAIPSTESAGTYKVGDKITYRSGHGNLFSAVVTHVHDGGEPTIRLYFPLDDKGDEQAFGFQGDIFRIGPANIVGPFPLPAYPPPSGPMPGAAPGPAEPDAAPKLYRYMETACPSKHWNNGSGICADCGYDLQSTEPEQDHFNEKEEEGETLYLNSYRCDHEGRTEEGQEPCEWQDEWSCACNDKCPVCNAEIEPYESTEITD